jgi:hypothetical protein
VEAPIPDPDLEETEEELLEKFHRIHPDQEPAV